MAAPQASSRLEMLQARFQQKQLQEKEQKLLQLYDQQQQRAYQVVQRGSAGSNGSNHGSSSSHHTVTRTSSTTHTTSTSQGGKVRQMFDERRQTTVKGIDRSYPLEPLENKTRKQGAANGGHKNGNVTVNRQSVTVKRVARADVNSNVNGGKPVISYHEEITRQSYDPSLRHHGDEDEFGNENHVLRYANGNYPEDSRSEVQIEEILDEDTIDRGREMGKINLLEFEENLKQRVRNDLESEEFPEHLIVDAPDRLPKRNVTKKLSQAEARLERFKNANLKRSTVSKTTTSTPSITKKRSEPIFPAKSSLRGGRAVDRADTQRRGDTPPSVGAEPKYSKSFEGTGASPGPLEIYTKPRGEGPQFFCRESERSATTFGIESSVESPPVSLKNLMRQNEGREVFYEAPKNCVDANNSVDTMDRRVKSEKLREIRTGDSTRRSRSPRFFCKESEIGATTMAIEPKIRGSPSPGSINSTKRTVHKDRAKERFPSTDLKQVKRRNESPSSSSRGSKKSTASVSLDKRSSEKFTTNVEKSDKSSVFFHQEPMRSSSPSFLNKESKKSTASMSFDKRNIGSEKLTSNVKKSDEGSVFFHQESIRSSSPSFLSKESKKSTASTSFDKRNIGSEKLTTNIKKSNESSVFLLRESTRSSTPTRSNRRSTDSSSPKCNRDLRGRGESPGFYNVESERSSSSMTVKPETARLDSPETMRFSSPDTENTERSSSPRYFCRETERSATSMSIDKKSTRSRSPTPEIVIKKRTSSPISSGIIKKQTIDRSFDSTQKFVSKSTASSSSIGAKMDRPRLPKTKDDQESRRNSPDSFPKESERSYGTIRRDRKPNDSPDLVSAKGRKVFQSGEKKPTWKSTRSKAGNRGPSKDSELSISSETPKPRSPIKPNIALRSTGVIRDIIKNQGSKSDETSVKSLAKSRSRREEIRIPALEVIEKISSIQASRAECPSADSERIEDFEADIEVRKGSISPPYTAHRIVLPELSPKSFTSSEMDKEIQEVLVSDQYIGDKSGGSAKGTVLSLKTDARGYYSKYPRENSHGEEKSKHEGLTYSLPCRKRPSVLKSNIFEDSVATRSNGGSRDRLCNRSPSRELKMENTTIRSVEKLTCSKESVSNASIKERRANRSPSNKFSFPATTGNETRHEVPRHREQTSSPTQPVKTKSVTSSSIERNGSKRHSKIVPAVKSATTRLSQQKIQSTSSKINLQPTLRSAKLVRQTINRVAPESGEKSGGLRRMRTISETEVDDSRGQINATGRNSTMSGTRTALSNKEHRAEGGENVREDFGRTDSVESALRRFDSIGAESEYQDAIKPRATDPLIAELCEDSASKSRETLEKGTIESRCTTSDKRVIETPSKMSTSTSSEISLKNLDVRRSNVSREQKSRSSSVESTSMNSQAKFEKVIVVKNTRSNAARRSREMMTRTFSSISKEKFAKTKDTRSKNLDIKISNVSREKKNRSRSSKSTSISNQAKFEKVIVVKSSRRSSPVISIARSSISKEKSTRAKCTMRMTRVDAQSVSPLCKRKLFGDKDPQEETESTDSKPEYGVASLKRRETFSPTNAKTAGEKAEPRGARPKIARTSRDGNSRIRSSPPDLRKSRTPSKESNASNSDRSLSVKQLRSIEDIRKSICQEESGQVVPENTAVNVVEGSKLKSAMATATERCLIAKKAEKSGDRGTSRSFIDSKVTSPIALARDTSPRSEGSEKFVSETETRLHRNTKSPSPDPVARKSLENNIRPTARRSVPSSPCKSPDTLARRPSTDLKCQEAKSSKRLPAVRQTESINSRKATVTKSMDVVDGVVLENGLHSRDRTVETKSENDPPPARKGDAFIVDFEDRTSKEDDAPIPRKSTPRKHPVEKQTSSTPGGRPVSSISSASSGSSTHGQVSGSRGKMTTRAKTPISGASPSKGLSATKSGGSTDNLVGCKICGRRFAHDRVSLHEQICAKTVQKKRKQFDAMMFRVKGTELEPFVKKGLTKKQSESKSKKPEVKSNWRRKHEDFINAIRSAKQVQAHLAAGGKLSDLPPPPASDTSDYIQCPHCGRKFNQAAAERHIPKCEHMLHNKPTHARVQKPRR